MVSIRIFIFILTVAVAWLLGGGHAAVVNEASTGQRLHQRKRWERHQQGIPHTSTCKVGAGTARNENNFTV